jgi:hypothetical protein
MHKRESEKKPFRGDGWLRRKTGQSKRSRTDCGLLGLSRHDDPCSDRFARFMSIFV